MLNKVLAAETTIFIPTMNRSVFLERCLRYYALAGFAGDIVVMDSSTGEEQAKSQAVCAATGPHLRRLVYQHNPPEVHVTQLFVFAGELAQTKYITFCADDDFHSTIGLELCQQFLEKNEGFGGARGQRVDATIGVAGTHGSIVNAHVVPYPPLTGATAYERMINYANIALSVHYSLFRTSVWRKAHALLAPPHLSYFSDEFFLCSFLLGLGKIETLSTLGAVRQLDTSGGLWRRTNMFQLLCTPIWPEVAAQWRTNAAAIMREMDGLSEAEVTKKAEEILWGHTAKLLAFQFQNRETGLQPAVQKPYDEALMNQLRGLKDFQVIEQVLGGAAVLPAAAG